MSLLCASFSSCQTNYTVILDLFFRLGYITPDDEPDFMKILNRLHGCFDYEKW